MDIQRNADPKNAEKMWDRRAANYPRYRDSEDTLEAKVMRLMEEKGADPTGLRVLDVGCGSGKYTLRLAKKAASVTATDISGEMLRILNEDAAKEGVTNITAVHADWSDFNPEEAEFDIVFCATTPAVRNEADFAKVTGIAGKFVVYLGFAGKKDSEVMMEIYKALNITPKRFNDIPMLKTWLDSRNLSYSSTLIEDKWEKRIPAAKMKEHCMDFLMENATEDALSAVDKAVSARTDSEGMASDTTHFRMELVIWETK